MSVSECCQSMSGSVADPPPEESVGARANLAPASIEVASNLAEDTVIAEVMDIAVGVNKVAMFANPFVGGAEEMLYVDEQATLRWARHVNSAWPASRGGAADASAVEHRGRLLNGLWSRWWWRCTPTGAVFAWVLHGDATSRQLSSFELVADRRCSTGCGGRRGRCGCRT